MSHSPLLDLTTQRDELEQDVRGALGAARDFANAFDPDVVVIFVPDHYNGFFYKQLPQFCMGTAASAIGDWDSLAGDLKVPTELARECAAFVMREGVDLATSHGMTVDHATAQPMHELFGALDARQVIPVFINSAAPPRAPLFRAHALGAAIGKFFAGRDERVLFIGSGGISHDPPVPALATAPPPVVERLISGRPPTDEELERKHKGGIEEGLRLAAGTSERKPLDPEWDERFIDLVTSGDFATLDTWSDEKIDPYGAGAHEVRTWVAAYAALGASGAWTNGFRYYRPIPEYIAGFGVTTATPSA
jgi:2,3-dihydroxyphenylpropionate 1,2-dioxygenase